MSNYGPFQIVEAKGSPYEIGFAHGEQAKEKIKLNIKEYNDMFQLWSGLDWEQAKVRSERYRKHIEMEEPDLLEEMQGIADGAGLEINDIITLNARSEVVFAQTSGACTAFTVTPEASANGHVLIGQNWDWRAPILDGLIILKIYQANKPSIFMVTEAGILGKIGMNSAGLGLCFNALVVQGEPDGLPLHIVLRRILNSYLLNHAMDAINSYKVAGPANYMIAQRDGCAIDVEKTPNYWDYHFNDTGILAHTNHILSQRLATQVKDLGADRLADSFVRYHMMAKMLNREKGNITVEYLMKCLRSHHQFPEGICHHVNPVAKPANRFMTCFSIIMDLNTSEVWLTLGPPCESEYTHYGVYF